MNHDFWHGKRVFVTGHTGFKGSWLALWLTRLGATFHGYSLPPPTTPSLFERAEIGSDHPGTFTDIRDTEILRKTLSEFGPDIVFHLAAQSVVLTSYEDPIETYSTNVVGTASVLQAVRGLRQRCAVVNVTTDKVYENHNWVWGYRETDSLGGHDPYSNSKACAELVARSFRDSFFRADGATGPAVGIASARAGNVIGGGDWTPHQLIPESVAAFSAGRPVVLRHPDAIRPWQHVLDCLAGYMTLAEALFSNPERYGDEFNFGPSDADMLPVAKVVEILAKPWGVHPAWIHDERVHQREAMELRLNSQKAIRELQWSTQLSIDAALAWTAEWFHEHNRGGRARSLCLDQIERHMGLTAANG